MFFTTDGWSNRVQKSFLGLTIQLITKPPEMAMLTLVPALIPYGKSDGESISELIKQTFSVRFKSPDFFETRCKGIWVDGASNMQRMVKKIDSSLGNNCFSHNVNLALKSWALTDTFAKNLFGKTRALIGLSRRSSKIGNHPLKERALHAFCPTRFYIYLLMLISVEQNSKMFKEIRDKHRSNASDQTLHKIAVIYDDIRESDLKDLIDLLSPIRRAMEFLGSDRSVAGLAIDVCNGMVDEVKLWTKKFEKEDVKKNCGERLLACLLQRISWIFSDSSLKKAAALDVRCVKRLDYLELLEPEMLRIAGKLPKKSKTVSVAKVGVLQLLRKEEREKSADQHQTVFLSAAEMVDEEIAIFRTWASQSAYFDPLTNFRECFRNLPILCELARQYLGRPMSQLASERLFSITGVIMAPRRCSLKPETLEKLAVAKILHKTSESSSSLRDIIGREQKVAKHKK